MGENTPYIKGVLFFLLTNSFGLGPFIEAYVILWNMSGVIKLFFILKENAVKDKK